MVQVLPAAPAVNGRGADPMSINPYRCCQREILVGEEALTAQQSCDLLPPGATVTREVDPRYLTVESTLALSHQAQTACPGMFKEGCARMNSPEETSPTPRPTPSSMAGWYSGTILDPITLKRGDDRSIRRDGVAAAELNLGRPFPYAGHGSGPL